jgi:hypothetical protein
MNNFYIYIYLDPKTNEPVYVGKGKGRRALTHRTKSKNKHLNSLIKKRQSEGYTCEPMILNMPSEQAALSAEKFYIAGIGRKDLKTGPLFNNTDGGEGVTGLVHSDKTKAKMSESRKGVPNGRKSQPGTFTGRKHTPETIAKMTGRKMSDEAKEKMSASAKGRKRSDEAIAKMAATNTGKKRPEHALAMTGRKHTPESIEKMKIARRSRVIQPNVGKRINKVVKIDK